MSSISPKSVSDVGRDMDWEPGRGTLPFFVPLWNHDSNCEQRKINYRLFFLALHNRHTARDNTLIIIMSSISGWLNKNVCTTFLLLAVNMFYIICVSKTTKNFESKITREILKKKTIFFWIFCLKISTKWKTHQKQFYVKKKQKRIKTDLILKNKNATLTI